MEDQLTPAVGGVLSIDSVVEEWVSQRVKPIIVPSSSIDDVPRITGIVQAIRIGLVLVCRGETLIYVGVTAEVEIHTVLIAVRTLR